MRIVIDTNVLVSATIKDKDPEAVILCVVSRPDLEWIASPEILLEYREVLARPKFALPAPVLQRWYEMLDTLVTPIAVASDVDFPRDRKDAKFLACALTAGAEFLITGDRDFAAQKLAATTIISVQQFKKLMCD